MSARAPQAPLPSIEVTHAQFEHQGSASVSRCSTLSTGLLTASPMVMVSADLGIAMTLHVPRVDIDDRL